MSKLDLTPEAFKSVLDDSEQLSLALMMLFDQNLTLNDLNTVIPPLLERLNDNLQTAQIMSLLQNQDLGGMGEAPMLSAVSPSPC